MSLRQCVDWLENAAEANASINHVGFPGQSFSNYPYAVVIPGGSQYGNSSISGKNGAGSHTVTLEIHYPLEQITANLNEAIALHDSFLTTFRSRQAGNGVQGIGPLSAEFSLLPTYGGIQTYGPSFTVTLDSEDEA